MWFLPALLALLGCRKDAPYQSTATASTASCDACEGGCVDEVVPAASAEHTEEALDYADPPPSGGDHNPCWAPWGVHTEEVPDENWVHNLEHGGVVFLYNCPEGCPEEVATLTRLVESLEVWALLTPYSELGVPFAAVSWEHRLLLQCVDEDVLDQWFLDHVNRGPESSYGDPSDSCM
jgi:hypothetical protein